jgi:preprotein translocase subunit SecE
MSRAVRRQQMIQKPPAKTPAFKPSGSRPVRKQEAAAVEAAKGKTSWRDRGIFRGIRDILAELRKVTWPTREEVVRLTIAVVVVAVVIGLALGGVDLFFNWLVDNTLLRP